MLAPLQRLSRLEQAAPVSVAVQRRGGNPEMSHQRKVMEPPRRQERQEKKLNRRGTENTADFSTIFSVSSVSLW